MTGSKKIITKMRPNVNNITVSYGDMSQFEVLGLGKVVVAPDISLVDIMLVETLGYNLLSVRALGKMGFAIFIDNDIVVLLWSKSLKVSFVGHIENNLYVVDFSKKTTTSEMCLFGKADVGWLWHRRLAHVNMRTLQSLHKGGHILGLKESFLFPKIVFAGLVFKEKCMTLPTQARLLFLPRGFWSSFMWISLVLRLMQVLVGRNIVW
jgi:hypothetical protein